MKTYYKNRCHTNGCENSGENAVLIQIKNNKIIIQVCEKCKELINDNNTKSKNETSNNYLSILDPISVMSMTLENMELRFNDVMDNEMKVPMKRMRRSIDKLVDHVSTQSQVKYRDDSETIKIKNLD